MYNEKIIYNFIKLIDYYKIIDENIFKINAIKFGLKMIYNYPKNIKKGDDLINYYGKKHGIGKGIINRVDEILKYGYLKEIKGNKIKKSQKLIEELNSIITISINTAKKLIKKYKLKNLNDFFKKVKNKIIKVSPTRQQAINMYRKYKDEVKRNEIYKLIKQFSNIFKNKNIKIKFVGSFRRGADISSDIDILMFYNKQTKLNLNNIINLLKKNYNIQDLTYKNIKTKYLGFIKIGKYYRRFDIRFMDIKSYYSSLLYFTGSATHNRILRSIAKKHGYKLNEYGLFKNNKEIKLKNEEHIYKIFNLTYIEPENRL